MIYLIWNMRGWKSPGKSAYLNDVILKHKIMVCAILEPKHMGKDIPDLALRLPFSNYSHFNPINHHIWLFWDSAVTLDVVVVHQQHVTVRIMHNASSILLSIVYGSIHVDIRTSLWSSLDQFSSYDENWIIGGDFNSILSQSEKLGGLLYSDRAISDFQNFVHNNSLLDVGFSGDPYTWCNGASGSKRIWIRLDRVLVNLKSSLLFSNLHVTHLVRHLSDHCPILIKLDLTNKSPHYFKFNKDWAFNETVSNYIHSNWSHYSTLDGNLFHVKSFLKKFSFDNRNSIKSDIAKDELLIKKLNDELQLRDNVDTMKALSEANTSLSNNLIKLDNMLKVKARVKWLTDGDRNTAYFQACIKERHFHSRWNFCLNDGSFTSNPNLIGTIAVDYFSKLLQSQNTNVCHDSINSFISILPNLVTNAQNDSLTRAPLWDEVLNCINSLDPDSAPGPDGFSGHFFRHYADVIKDNLMVEVSNFFQGLPLNKSFTSTILTLVPKKANPTCMNDIRPISLCNFKYKILSKILCDRLALIIPFIISKEQSGFVKGRLITDNILLAHELVHNLDRKADGGNVLIKVDMSKAYDRLEWSFLIKVLKKFGFSSKFCDLILNCISNNWFSVQIQGCRLGYFKSYRGLRQGDPISSSLFILAQEAFSRVLNFKMDMGDIGFFRAATNLNIKISHLFFADDLLVFTNGKAKSLKNLSNLFKDYERCSGQMMNKAKSSFVCSNYIIGSRKRMIKHLLQVNYANLPLIYLGLPLFKGRVKSCYFSELVDKIRGRVNNWKNKFLSHAGKLTLINSILNSIPLYMLSCIKAPKVVFNNINSIISNFFWSLQGQRRVHWCRWDKLCLPCDEGGLGVKSLLTSMKAFQIKNAFLFLKQSSLCASFLANKYGMACFNWQLPVASGASNVWKIIHSNLPYALEHSRWIINGGDRFFWLDNWSGNVLWFEGCSNPFISIRNAFLDVEFRSHIPANILIFMQDFILNSASDIFICTLNSAGTFKTAAIYDSIRISKPKCNMYKFIWHSVIPPKISVFMWRALNGALPVDELIQSRNISLASKCFCCANPGIETIDHLFVYSEIAIKVWKFYSHSLGFHFIPLPFDKTVNLWMSHASWNSQHGAVIAILGNVIPWCIWNMRNQVKFGKGRRNLNEIFKCVYNLLNNVCNLVNFKRPCSYLKQLMLSSIHINIIKPVIQRGSWHHWRPPNHGLLKLNTDGSLKDNSCAGGGVVRDSNGDLLLAYTVNVGIGDCNYAEAHSLYFGLKLCLDHNLFIHEIELDSKLLIDCLNLKVEIPWNLIYLVRQCHDLCNQEVSFLHSVREGNMLADCLSKHGHHLSNPGVFRHPADLPSCCYSCFISDQLGLSYFRPP